MKTTATITAITIFIGIIISFISYNYVQTQDFKIYFSILLTLMLPILANLVHHRITHEQFSMDINKNLHESSAEIKNNIYNLECATATMEKLCDSPDEKKLLYKLIDNIQSVRSSNNNFFINQQIHQLQLFCEKTKSLSDGVYDCQPEEEIFLTKTIILSINKTIKAVSYQDTPWWKGADGISYLNLHRQAIDNGHVNETIRIFIIDEAEKDQLSNIIEFHKNLNVTTYILDPSDVPSECKRDFVIYDNLMVREAEPATSGKVGKKARFSTKQIDLKKATEQFEVLENIAKGKMKL